MSIESLHKRIDALIEQIEQQQQERATRPHVVLCLPLKDNEPQEPREVDYGLHIVRFYIPELREA